MPAAVPRAIALLDTIDRQRAALLATVAALTPAQRAWRSSASACASRYRLKPCGPPAAHHWTPRDTWASQHRDLRALVERLDAAGLRRRIFRHPIAGPISVVQALTLLSAHLDTYRRQLERLERARRHAGNG